MFTCRLTILVILSVLLLPSTNLAQTRNRDLAAPLEVSLSSDRTSGTMGDSIVLTTAVKNAGSDPIFVYGDLDWGPSSSFFLFVTDDKGKNVPMSYFEDALPPMPSKTDKTIFIKLNPGVFFGMNRTDKLSALVPKPGTYFFQVVYHGPVSRRFAPRQPAWGTEDPPVLSNKVRIDVQ
jgi:hypothetical protein